MPRFSCVNADSCSCCFCLLFCRFLFFRSPKLTVLQNQMQGGLIFSCVQVGVVGFCDSSSELNQVTEEAAGLKIETFVRDVGAEIGDARSYWPDLDNRTLSGEPYSPAKIGLLKIGPAKIGPAKIGLLKIGPTKIGLLKIGPAKIGLLKI